MSKNNTHENDTLSLIFTNTAPSLPIGGGGGILPSSTAGNLYIALFTGDPGEDQSGVAGSECSYTGYNRVAVPRSTSYWTVSGGSCTNDNAITFGTCSVGTENAVFFGICTAGTKTISNLIMSGQLSGGGLTISPGKTPQIEAGNMTISED